uniref:Uncharacterized protein n=1 Tax=Anguilla anguilla TaxID=7936 RepID=A0A0E9XCH5_ANGAN
MIRNTQAHTNLSTVTHYDTKYLGFLRSYVQNPIKPTQSQYKVIIKFII